MCAPTHFGVDYVINPWMKSHVGVVDRAKAGRQWEALRAILAEEFGADIALVEPIDGLPDMVFTANAGLVIGRKVIPARFRYAERRGEEPFFTDWFARDGFEIVEVEGHQEGAGDLLFVGDLLFGAYGFRTDPSVHTAIAAKMDVEIVSLELVDPRFYHLDTCFCPLPGERLLWYPPAFSPPAQEAVERRIPTERRYAVSEEDAACFACNAVAVEGRVVMNACDEAGEAWLSGQGFRVYRTPLDEFMKAGGAAKCLTLRLD